jgi:hydrogenase expression/formation protein HypD
LAERIGELASRDISLMEFCGTHTHEIFRYGIRDLLPEEVRLLSGPGCPVCVTSEEDIDYLIALAGEYDLGIITFGDLVNVPGSRGSLARLRAEGHEVRPVYSPLTALEIARDNPAKEYVLVGIGFETTAPILAYTLKEAKRLGIGNLLFFAANKLTPPAMEAILERGEVHLDGILGPGHVSTVIGSRGWREVQARYGIPLVITGFEPRDILFGVYQAVRLVAAGAGELVNAYPRCVTEEGNRRASALMYEVFEVGPANWRGLGEIPRSGLHLRGEYREFDVRERYPLEVESASSAGCRCGEVLRGAITPRDCPLFAVVCTPHNPKGPCMVSSEGTCAAYYLYGGGDG